MTPGAAGRKTGRDAGPETGPVTVPDTRRFEVDADLTTASTLDKSFYLDPAVWSLAIERIFARSWIWTGDLRAVAAAGTLAPIELLAGSLDEPLLLARDRAGAEAGGAAQGTAQVPAASPPQSSS